MVIEIRGEVSDRSLRREIRDQSAHRWRPALVKRIAAVICSILLCSTAARADGVKAVAGTLGTGAISSVLCLLAVEYLDKGETSAEGFDRRGFFVGASGFYAGENFSENPAKDVESIFGPLTTSSSDDSWSVQGHVGYRCHPRFSVAASGEYFGGFDTSWAGFQGAGSDDIDLYAVTVDLKGYLLTGRYQPFLMLGGGTMSMDTKPVNPTGIICKVGEVCPPGSMNPPATVPTFGPLEQAAHDEDFVFRFGAGIDLYATRNVVVSIGGNYMLPVGTLVRLDLYTIGGGVEFRF
jgi:hypothetical protein